MEIGRKIIMLSMAISLFIAQAVYATDGGINITNKDCNYEILKTDAVNVHIYDPQNEDPNVCTNTWHKVTEGKTVFVPVIAGDKNQCVYRHEAAGTILGARDAPGNETTDVTCARDGIGVCQCAKD